MTALIDEHADCGPCDPCPTRVPIPEDCCAVLSNN